MKRAIIYYSLNGNTKEAAEVIAAALETDIFRIEAVKPLPKSRFGAIMTGGMQVTFGLCPPIREMPLNVAEYDQIILGTPIWAGKCAAPVMSFLKQYGAEQLDEKITAVFTCSGGGDNDGCIEQLKNQLNGLQTTVALADKNNPACSDNERKLQEFILRLPS